ncbi:MAG: acetyl-CoA C-acyltransferase, partial [Acidimicrobiia bacterium]
VELLGDVQAGLIERTGIDPMVVGHVLGGCITQIGNQAANVVRNAWLGAGLPLEVPAATVQSQCGSSQEAHTLAHAMVKSGLVDVAIACGIESMSKISINASFPVDSPYGFPRAGRYATRYEPTTQFEAGERIAQRWGITREDLDAYAYKSQTRAAAAWAEGRLDGQIIPINAPVADENGNIVGRKVFDRDEAMRPTTLEALAALKPNMKERTPAFHTAGTSSQISDAASAILMATAERAKELGLRAKARIVDSVLVGSDPELMLTGPIPVTEQLLKRNGLSIGDIDLFEINEAFGSVVLAWAKETGADLDKTNVNGGAIAVGHPLGASGTLLITRVLHELERSGGRYALISMCCGGGLGTGTLIERV